MNANAQQPERRLVVATGSAQGRVYVVEAGGDQLKLTQAPGEARRFDDPQEAARLVQQLESGSQGGEARWTVLDLDRSEGGEPHAGADLPDGNDLGTPAEAGRLSGADALGGAPGDIGRGAD